MDRLENGGRFLADLLADKWLSLNKKTSKGETTMRKLKTRVWAWVTAAALMASGSAWGGLIEEFFEDEPEILELCETLDEEAKTILEGMIQRLTVDELPLTPEQNGYLASRRLEHYQIEEAILEEAGYLMHERSKAQEEPSIHSIDIDIDPDSLFEGQTRRDIISAATGLVQGLFSI